MKKFFLATFIFFIFSYNSYSQTCSTLGCTIAGDLTVQGTFRTTGSSKNISPFNLIAKNILQAANNNIQINYPLTIPTWTIDTLYFSGEKVKSTDGTNYFEVISGNQCTSSHTAGGPTGTGTNVADLNCIWGTTPNPNIIGNSAPTITTGTQWVANTTYRSGLIAVTYTGSGASAVGNFYTSGGGVSTPAAATGLASFATNVMTVNTASTGTWGVGQTVTSAGVTGGTVITSLGTGVGGTGTYNLSTSPGTISNQAASATGNGPTGGTTFADGTITWTFLRTVPTAIFSSASVKSYLWNGGVGAGVGNITAYTNILGGTVTNSSGTSYFTVNSPTVAGVSSVITEGRIEFITTASVLVIRSFENASSIWRIGICDTNGMNCHYVSPNHNGIPLSATGLASFATNVMTVNTASSGTFAVGQAVNANSVSPGVLISSLGTGVGGTGTYNLSATVGTIANAGVSTQLANQWTRTIIDFSAVGGKSPRHIILEDGTSANVGGIDISLLDDLYPSGGMPIIYAATVGDSYPTGGGVQSENWSFPRIAFDTLGIRSNTNSAIGGCGYTASLCTSGSMLSRISDLTRTQGGLGPQIILIGNGTNDVGVISANAIAAAQTSYIQAVRANSSLAQVPIFILGIYAHNTSPCANCIAAEQAEIAAVTAMNVTDPNIFFCPWSTDNSPWETGNGNVQTPNGSGNSDVQFDFPFGHPNGFGNRAIAGRLAKCIRNVINAGGY